MLLLLYGLLFTICASWEFSSLTRLANRVLNVEIIDPQSEYCVPANLLCRCPVYADYANNVETILKNNLFGQDEAVDTLINAMRAHDFRAGKATTIHIAGPNGVGKTHASQLLTQAIYRRRSGETAYDGHVYIRGGTFRDVNDIEKARNALQEKIFRQLQRCPHSLIVIDEVEVIHPDIIHFIHQFIDTTVNYLELYGEQVVTNKAIYLLISDFGPNDARTEGMTVEEIKNLVYKESAMYWNDLKTNSLIDFIIPFYPQSREGTFAMVKHHLGQLKNHHTLQISRNTIAAVTYDETALNDIVGAIEVASKKLLHRNEHYRGVGKVFKELVVPPFLEALSPHKNAKLNIALSFKDSKILVAASHVPQIAKVGKSEFR